MNKIDIYNKLKQQQLKYDIESLENKINRIQLASIIEQDGTFNWAEYCAHKSMGIYEAMENILGRDYLLNAQSNDETKSLLNKWFDLNNKHAELKKA